MKFTHLFGKFTHTFSPNYWNYTFSFQFQQKKGLKSFVMKFYVVLSLAKIVAIYAALVCKFVGSKFRSCKFFDKSQVCMHLFMNWIKAAQHSFFTVRAIAKTIDLFQSKISLHMLIWCFNMERLLFYVNAPLVSNVILFGSACFFCSLIFWHHRCSSGNGNLKDIQSTTYSHILSTTRFAHSAHQSSVHFNNVLKYKQ